MTAVMTLRSVVRGRRVRRWPLIVSAVLLAALAIGGLVLLVLRLTTDGTITIGVGSFGG